MAAKRTMKQLIAADLKRSRHYTERKRKVEKLSTIMAIANTASLAIQSKRKDTVKSAHWAEPSRPIAERVDNWSTHTERSNARLAKLFK